MRVGVGEHLDGMQLTSVGDVSGDAAESRGERCRTACVTRWGTG